MRILIISNLYPDTRQPTFGTFIADRVDSLRAVEAAVDLVAIRGHAAHREVVRKYLSLAVRSTVWLIRAIAQDHRADIVEAHIAYPTLLLAWPVARLSGAGLVGFAHGADVREVGNRSVLHRRLARWILGRADLVVANSPTTCALLASEYGVRRARLVTWSPGIDRRVFRPQPERLRDPRQVLYVGRLHPEKGVDILIEALAKVSDPKLTLRVIGEGPAEEDLRRLSSSHGLAVRFDGPMRSAEVAAAMAEAGVVVVPSVVAEGLGLVAIEAMATGALVVASAIGGLRDTVRDRENGWLVPAGDIPALTDTIREAAAIGLQGGPIAEGIRAAAISKAATHDRALLAAQAVQAYRDARFGTRGRGEEQ